MRFRFRYVLVNLPALYLLVALAAPLQAQLLPTLSAGDRQLVETCQKSILKCQLKDGAVMQVGLRLPGMAADIDPYGANLAALGILAAHQNQPSLRNTRFVEQWIAWYAANQDPATGIAGRFTGLQSQDGRFERRATLPPDSHAATAASYLLLVERYAASMRRTPAPEVVGACKRCVEVLRRCRADGFYWAFDPQAVPAGKVQAQYLHDNIEVCQALVAVSRLFEFLKEADAADTTRDMAATLSDRFHDFWWREQECFVSILADKAAKKPWGTQPLALDGLATVSAIAVFDQFPESNRRRLWRKLSERHGPALRKNFTTLEFQREAPTVERYYFAAKRAASAEEEKEALELLRKRCADLQTRTALIPSSLANPNQPEEVAKFNRLIKQEYPPVQRYGLMLIALLSQPSRSSPFWPTIALDWPDPPLPDPPRKKGEQGEKPRATQRPTFTERKS